MQFCRYRKCTASALARTGLYVSVPEELLGEGFRRAVLKFLARNDAIPEDLRSTILNWHYGGFSAHNQVRGGEQDAEGRK